MQVVLRLALLHVARPLLARHRLEAHFTRILHLDIAAYGRRQLRLGVGLAAAVGALVAAQQQPRPPRQVVTRLRFACGTDDACLVSLITTLGSGQVEANIRLSERDLVRDGNNDSNMLTLLESKHVET